MGSVLDGWNCKSYGGNVEKFKERIAWDNLSAEDVYEIETHLSCLPAPEKVHESTRRFDLLILKL